MNIAGSGGSVIVNMTHIDPEDYPRLRYAAAGYSGCNSSGLTQWHQCVYDVREPPVKPSFTSEWVTTENSLTVHWNATGCGGQRVSRAAFILLQITESGTGNMMFLCQEQRQRNDVMS
jgi:hypothetical protein